MKLRTLFVALGIAGCAFIGGMTYAIYEAQNDQMTRCVPQGTEKLAYVIQYTDRIICGYTWTSLYGRAVRKRPATTRPTS